MNTTPRSLLLAAACAAFALSGNSEAAVRTKAATGTDLTAGASWDTLPGSGDVATWTSTSLGASLTIGSSIEWQGINVSGALTDIAITAADTTTRLTIGSSGISLTGTRNLTLGANLGIGANQTWSIDGGRSLVLLAASRNANGTGNIDIVQTGSGVANVRMSQNGNSASWANFSGNVTVNSNVTVQSEGNAAAAFGTGTITLNGGQITQANGNWTWSNNIDVTAASVIGNNSSLGLGRTLKLTGNLTSSNSSGLTFTNNITGGTRTDNLGFLLAGAGPSTYTTTTISANSRVRVGGTADNTVASPGLNAGNRGSLGTGNVTLSATTSELAFTRTDAHTVGNKITGSGTVVIGGNTTELAGTSTQVVTLSGASDYTGATRVSRSRLNLTGSLTSAITVDNSGSISGTGSTNQLLTLASTGRIALAGGATTTSITANGATFSGSNVVTFLSAPVNTTVYDVFTYGAGAVTTPGNLTADARGTLSNDVGNQKYIFTATGPATRTWNTTTGTWDLNTTTSFLEDDQKFVSWDNVVFGNVASDSVVTLSGTIVPGSVTVNNAANKYTFAGAAITGTTSLTKSGAGTLELTVANTYTGGTTLNAGTLQVGNASALGTGTLTVTGGTLTSGSTELSIANNITLNGSVILTGTAGTQGMRLNGVIGGAGGITKEGTGRFTIVNDSLATPNTFAGSTTVNAGILAVSINALASSSSVHVAGTTDGGLAIGGNGTTSIKNLTGTVDGRIRSDFNLSGNGARTLKITQTTNGTFAGAFIEGGSRQISLVKEGSATLTLSGEGGYSGTTTINDGVLEVTSLANGGNPSSIGGSAATATNLVFGAAGATLRYAGTVDASTNRGFTMSSGVGGGATIEASGSATLPATAKLTMTAGTAINYGTVDETRVLTLGGTYSGADNVFGKLLGDNGTGATSLVKGGASIWQLSNANTYTGGTTVNAGRLTLENNTAAGTGTITVNSGTGTESQVQTGGGLNIANALVISNTGDQKTLRHFNATASEYSGGITINETTQDNFRIQVGVGANLKVSGAIDGVGGFQKINTGTLELTNANTYAGDTTITTGSLIANNTTGSATGTGAVTVASGATLGGTGTISGAVTVTGKISPGDGGIGTLNTGAVTWKGASASGAITNWDFALGSVNASDKLNITGNFTKDTALGSVFNFDFLGSAFTGIFTLAQWTGSTTFAASDFSYSNLGGGHTGTFTINGATKELQFTAVPEPTSAVAGLLLGAGLLRRRREKNVEC